MDNNFYVYELWDPIKDVPFYVGFGKRNRKGSKLDRHESHVAEAIVYSKTGKLRKGANLHKLRAILQIMSKSSEVLVKVVADNLSIEEATSKEVELILKYGRRDLKTGTLTNLSAGGFGAPSVALEVRKKISLAKMGKPNPKKGIKLGPYSPERVLAAKEGKKASDEKLTKEELRKRRARPGRKVSRVTAEKISKSLKGRPSPMKGKEPWNKGLTKETDERINLASKKVSKSKKGKEPWNKGKRSPNKGKTYSEIYGPEKAAELLEMRRQSKKQYWDTKRSKDKNN